MFAGITGDFDAGVLFDTPNRELASSQGRWVSPDPASSGWNQYAYSTNPNSFGDPTGLSGCRMDKSPLCNGGGAGDGGGLGSGYCRDRRKVFGNTDFGGQHYSSRRKSAETPVYLFVKSHSGLN
jgi:RHS repeat-associated protein